jgi:hypothetical protein
MRLGESVDVEVHDPGGEGVFLQCEIFEGIEEGAHSEVLIGLLGPEDHLE